MGFSFGRSYCKIQGYNLDLGFTMPIIRRLARRLLTNDIVSVQPMGRPIGQLHYIEFIITPKMIFKFGRYYGNDIGNLL